jgi:hypothetical protein
MRLKAPPGVGDPCVAGVTIAPRDGVYEVEAEIGALLMECFGFMDAGDGNPKGASVFASAPVSRPRRGRPSTKKS